MSSVRVTTREAGNQDALFQSVSMIKELWLQKIFSDPSSSPDLETHLMPDVRRPRCPRPLEAAGEGVAQPPDQTVMGTRFD